MFLEDKKTILACIFSEVPPADAGAYVPTDPDGSASRCILSAAIARVMQACAKDACDTADGFSNSGVDRQAAHPLGSHLSRPDLYPRAIEM